MIAVQRPGLLRCIEHIKCESIDCTTSFYSDIKSCVGSPDFAVKEVQTWVTITEIPQDPELKANKILIFVFFYRGMLD